MSTNKHLIGLWAIVRRFLVFMVSMALIAPTAAPLPLRISAADTENDKILLQFKTSNHLIGFSSRQVYFAAFDHLASIEFVGANLVTPQAQAQSPSASQTGAAELGEVFYRNLWNGIDTVYASDRGSIAKATYFVAAGADPAKIHLRYNTPVVLKDDGSLWLEYERGALHESPPVAWQEIAGQRVMVEVAFRVLGEREVGFQVGNYNRRLPLVIDPVYQWHTFYGGSPDQQATAIAVDADGNVYFTASVNGQYYLGSGVSPTSGYYYSGSYDIAVGRYLATGSPSWIRLFGSDKQDYANGIVVDNTTGHLFVTGSSNATWNGPVGSPLNSHSGGEDIVVIRMLKNTGDYLSHAFFGSAYDDVGRAIALSSDNKVIVVGYCGDSWNGPGNVSPIRAFTYGYEEMVVLSLTASTVNSSMSYNWHTFYGSSESDIASGVVLDGSNNIYFAGSSDRSWNNGVTGPLNAHSSSGSANDLAVVKLNGSGEYQWHTFFGSSSGDVATSIAFNGTNLYIGGYSTLSWSGPGTSAPKHAHSGGSDLTILALNTSGGYLWHTFYGSSSADEGRGITADASFVYLVGTSANTWNNGATAALNAHSGDLDLAVVKVSASNGTYQWHTFYGSPQKDSALAAIVAGGRLLLAGYSENDWVGMSVFHLGGRNTVILELTTAGIYTRHRFAGLQIDDEFGGMALDSGRNIILTGFSDHSWLGPSNQAPKNPHGNATTNLFVLKLNPSGGYLWHTFLGGSILTEGEDVAIGPSDMILVVGDSSQNWTGPGGASPLRAHTGDGLGDIFLVAINSSGVYGWHTFVSGAKSDWAQAVAVYASDVFIAGSSSGTWNGPSGQAPKNPYTPTGSEFLVAKYNTSGNYQWHTFYGSSVGDGALDLVVDNAGNSFLVGISEATWNGPAPSNTAPKHAHSNSGYDFAILKLNISGNYLWHTFYGGIDSDTPYEVALDSQNNVFIVGKCARTWLGDGNVQPRNNPNNPAINIYACALSLTSAGNYRWHTFYGGDGSNQLNQLNAVAVDSKGFVYAVGSSNSSWVGPGGQLPLHPHTGTTDINLITLDSNGDYYEHDFLGGGSGIDHGYAVLVDPQGGLLVGGESHKTWQGDNNTSPLNALKGAMDILVMRLTPLANRIFIPLIRR